MTADGNQQLGFEDEAGQALELRSLDGATLWLDRQGGRMGRLARVVDEGALRIVTAAPIVSPQEAEALGARGRQCMTGRYTWESRLAPLDRIVEGT